MNIEESLQGRWVSTDDKASLFFQFPEEDDAWGLMRSEYEGQGKDRDAKIVYQNSSPHILYRNKGETVETVSEISLISSSRLRLRFPQGWIEFIKAG